MLPQIPFPLKRLDTKGGDIMDFGDITYIDGYHFFEVESADDIGGRKKVEMRYFTNERDARSYFEDIGSSRFVWLTEIGDCYAFKGKWRVFDWSPAVAASDYYPYPSRGRCTGYISEMHTEVKKQYRHLQRRYTPHDPTFRPR